MGTHAHTVMEAIDQIGLEVEGLWFVAKALRRSAEGCDDQFLAEGATLISGSLMRMESLASSLLTTLDRTWPHAIRTPLIPPSGEVGS